MYVQHIWHLQESPLLLHIQKAHLALEKDHLHCYLNQNHYYHHHPNRFLVALLILPYWSHYLRYKYKRSPTEYHIQQEPLQLLFWDTLLYVSQRKPIEVSTSDFPEFLKCCRGPKNKRHVIFLSAQSLIKGVKTALKVYPRKRFFFNILSSNRYFEMKQNGKYFSLNDVTSKYSLVLEGGNPYFLF